MRKRCLRAFFVLCFLFSVSWTVFAREHKGGKFASTLPNTFSDQITMKEIQDDILKFISWENLRIQVGTDEYMELLDEFSFKYNDVLDTVTKQYYKAYVSVYMSEEDEEDDVVMDKSIQAIRNENSVLNQEREQYFLNQAEANADETYDPSSALKFPGTHVVIDPNSYYAEHGNIRRFSFFSIFLK